MIPPRLIPTASTQAVAECTGLEGGVHLHFRIDPHGIPTHIQIKHLQEPWRTCVFNIVSLWRYDPARKHGKPIGVDMNLELTFTSGRERSGTPMLIPKPDAAH